MLASLLYTNHFFGGGVQAMVTPSHQNALERALGINDQSCRMLRLSHKVMWWRTQPVVIFSTPLYQTLFSSTSMPSNTWGNFIKGGHSGDNLSENLLRPSPHGSSCSQLQRLQLQMFLGPQKVWTRHLAQNCACLRMVFIAFSSNCWGGGDDSATRHMGTRIWSIWYTSAKRSLVSDMASANP